MRYKVICSYDGQRFSGFQSQKNGITIQDEIEKALKKFYKKETKITIASRTDAGVHAYGQVFSYESDKEINPYNIKQALNTFLKDDIHIIDVKKVNDDFHPRYMVKEKTYEYLINIGEFNPLLINRAYQCKYKLDIDLMKKASKVFIGKHDFSSFNTATYEEMPNQIREISEFKIIKKKDLIIIRVSGNGFLRNQVRIMVGSLIEVGRGKKNIEDLINMLEIPNKGTRRYCIEAGGLYLIKIKY